MSDSDTESAELPSLDDLRSFVAVAGAGSLRAAAARLFTSQPTLSRAVSRLEAQLGVELLVRGARGVQLTRHGELLLARAHRLLAAASDLRREIAAQGAGTLQLGATATSARRLLAPYLASWLPAHPEIRVKGIEDSEPRLHDHLEMGRCDLAIVTGPVSSGLESLHVVTANVIAVFPPGHPRSGDADPVRVLDLAGEPLLLNGDRFPSTALLRRAMDTAGVHPDVVYECSAGQTLAAMTEAGLGVAIFGDTVDLRGFDLPRHPVLDAVGEALTFDLYVAWPRQAPPWVRDFALGLSTFHRAG